MLDFQKNPLLETQTETSSGPPPIENFNPPFVPGLTSVIVICHNTTYPLFHYTGNAIGSVKEHTSKHTIMPYEIILVDNGSTVKPSKLSDYNADKVIVNETNVGVSKAFNQGIRVSSGEYICLLNNDTQVFDYWLEDLQEALQSLDLVMATPMYGEPFSRAVEAQRKRSFWEGKSPTEAFSDFRDFACVLTRKALFDEVGMFDEQFFAYCEDSDFLHRLESVGKKYASTKKVNIYHVIGATAREDPRMAEIMNESKALFNAKWGIS